MDHSQSYSGLSVVKSNRVIEAKYRLGARAQKFILFMASMVNPMDGEFKYLKVKVKDIEPIFNTDMKKWGSIYQIVKDIILSLNNHPLRIEQEDGSHLIVNWIASAEIRQGSGMVEFEFSEKLRPYLLQLKSHFTKYKLQNILQLKSAFSIRLYELLKARQFIGRAEYELDDLKAILGLDKKYNVYYDFKRRVLLPAQEELSKFSDIWFEFKERKQGRKVKYLVFDIHENVKVVQEIEATDDLPEVKSPLIEELVKLGFSRFKAIELFQLGFDVLIDGKVREMARSAYESAENFFKEKLELTKFEYKNGKVHNPTGFFLKAIQEDYQSKNFRNAQKQQLKKKQIESNQALKNQYKQLYETQRKLLFEQQQQLINQIFVKRPKVLSKALDQYQLTGEVYKKDALARAKVNAWIINRYSSNFESLKELEQNILELKKMMDRL